MSQPVDVSKMFPDYKSAFATRHGDVAVFRLHHHDGKRPLELVVSVIYIYQALEALRKVPGDAA